MTGVRYADALVLAALAAACSHEGSKGTAGGAQDPVVRDSAGVRIVENGEASAAGWRVGTEPLFTVGWDPDGPTFS